MKVLIVHCTYKYKGGEDTVVSEEMNLLQSNGVTVELLQFTNDGNTLVKLLQLPFNISSYFLVINKLGSYKPDVVHVHNWHFAASASVLYAIKKAGIPFVVTLHNYRLLCPSAILFNKGKLFLYSLRQKFPWKAVSEGVYKQSRFLTFWVSFSMQIHHWLNTWKMCNRFIVLTQYAKNIFLNSTIKITGDQIVVKPNFCAVPALQPVKAADYFLFVGRLSEEKGIDLLLKTFATSPYTIKIAGDGPLLGDIITYRTQYPNIEFLGSMEKARILDLMCHCNALVFPSIWYEGMPLTIIEAFACGTPVIASRLGAMESMIEPGYNGLHFEAGNENDLKIQLEKWQHLDGEQKELYRKNARSSYEQYYTPEKNFMQLMHIYKAVMEEGSR